ncbi:F0F1 ATP synthase subunit B [Aerococcaceae bacterium INB8]|uniref:ATP synthase subunit b n=1 Tax=Ruoffia halotolerans TaxID=2748684 RepID=A0A839A3P8_9LACT|nr:F0F1 ATP synthase subunit B [Ruoffia halotolerans]MBA5728846.1 F0F1 ATP synthase subunit B [Ruoffia halotolerans]
MLESILQTGVGHFLMTIISFAILLFIVSKFAWDPISKILQEREEMIESNINDAKTAKKNAEATEDEAREMLTNARTEANKLVQDTKWQVSKMKADQIEQAKEEIEEMRTQAELSIQRERRQMLESMEDQIGKLSIEIAEQVLRREVNSKDHQQLISELVLEMDASINESR